MIAPEALDDWLEAAAPRLEAVIHMGAISDTTERDADALASNNIGLSQRLWSFCAARGLPLVYASSAATYGDGAEGFDDDASEAALARLSFLDALVPCLLKAVALGLLGLFLWRGGADR